MTRRIPSSLLHRPEDTMDGESTQMVQAAGRGRFVGDRALGSHLMGGVDEAKALGHDELLSGVQADLHFVKATLTIVGECRFPDGS